MEKPIKLAIPRRITKYKPVGYIYTDNGTTRVQDFISEIQNEKAATHISISCHSCKYERSHDIDIDLYVETEVDNPVWEEEEQRYKEAMAQYEASLLQKEATDKLVFRKGIKVSGGLNTSFCFTSDAEVRRWMDEDLPVLESKYGDLTITIFKLDGLGVGDLCFTDGNTVASKITGIVQYSKDIYGFRFDTAGSTAPKPQDPTAHEEVVKCRAIESSVYKKRMERYKAYVAEVQYLEAQRMKKGDKSASSDTKRKEASEQGKE